MQTKCFDIGKFTHKSNKEDQLVIQAFGCLPKTREANTVPSSAAALSLSNSTPPLVCCCLMALWEEKHSLAFLGVCGEFLR